MSSWYEFSVLKISTCSQYSREAYGLMWALSGKLETKHSIALNGKIQMKRILLSLKSFLPDKSTSYRNEATTNNRENQRRTIPTVPSRSQAYLVLITGIPIIELEQFSKTAFRLWSIGYEKPRHFPPTLDVS